jgi:hypothetical protein
MADESARDEKAAANARHEPPAGAETTAIWTAQGLSIEYTASAEWIVSRKKEKPASEIFSASYVAHRGDDRPVTSSSMVARARRPRTLHMGHGRSAAGRVSGGRDAAAEAAAASGERGVVARVHGCRVRQPVGTGFSRVIEDDRNDDEDSKKKENGGDPDAREYFGYKRDLKSLCKFMGRWLSGHKRWGSRVHRRRELGGYRVGRLVRMLQETAGIGLSGAVLISPALEFASLSPSDYNVVAWLDLVPTMAIAAVHYRRSRAFAAGTSPADVLEEAEAFATGDYAVLLTRGA